MKKVVLTGATGFLGFALLTELIQNDVHVYALCRDNSHRRSRLDGLPHTTVIEGDVSHIEAIDGISNCDVFYHLAWGGGRNDFVEQYKNVDMSVNCLKLAEKLGCRRFICTGSQAEYGDVTDIITEETSLNPTTAYGACKAATYYLTVDLAKRLHIEHTWVRVFSVYGPHDNPNTLIMSLVRDLQATGEARLNTDGEHIWNYLYEEDVARALRLLGWSSRSNTVYNLASQDNKPLKEFVEDVREQVGADSVVGYGTDQSMIHLNASSEKIRLAIGEFEKVEFVDGIHKTLIG